MIVVIYTSIYRYVKYSSFYATLSKPNENNALQIKRLYCFSSFLFNCRKCHIVYKHSKHTIPIIKTTLMLLVKITLAYFYDKPATTSA
jgi:hypothetical protein